MRSLTLSILLPAVALAACGSHPTPTAGSQDGGSIGGGGGADAGSDAGPSAAEPPPGSYPAVACQELGGVDPWTPAPGTFSVPEDLGRILACEHTASLGGYDEFIIQYITQGPIGTLHRASALLYLPTGGASGLPLVAVDHGTSGMGPSCGPSHVTQVSDYMALPLVQAGYAVVAPDYVGMGVDEGGVSPYMVGEAAAYAILDGVRAMKGFHDPRFDASQLSGELFVAGHSQGGQATLFAQQLFDPTATGFTLLGSVSWAPGLGDVRELGQVLSPSASTQGIGTLLLMGLYGQWSYHGAPPLASWLTDSAQTQLPSLLHDQCLSEELSSIPNAWPTFGDALTPAFLSAAEACPLDGGSCPSFEPWASELLDAEPGSFTSSVPALILQGESDTTVPPETTACIAQRLEQHDTPVQLCGYAMTDHLSIVQNSMADAVRWMAARRQGQTPNVCPAPLAESCNP
ncbi:MAG: alpha/beta hydrolase [Deltaproteobacteria bacterium]